LLKSLAEVRDILIYHIGEYSDQGHPRYDTVQFGQTGNVRVLDVMVLSRMHSDSMEYIS
jgi:hypothetical protein